MKGMLKMEDVLQLRKVSIVMNTYVKQIIGLVAMVNVFQEPNELCFSPVPARLPNAKACESAIMHVKLA